MTIASTRMARATDKSFGIELGGPAWPPALERWPFLNPDHLATLLLFYALPCLRSFPASILILSTP